MKIRDEDVLTLKTEALKSEFKLNDLNTPKAILNKIIVIIILPVLFGTQIYPNVDRTRGGGKPLEAKIIMQSDITESLRGIAKNFRIDFDNAKIILETRESLFLGVENNIKKKVAIEISKRNIIAVVYKKSSVLPAPIVENK